MSSQPASDLDQVRTYFRNFGLKQAPENGSPLYHRLVLRRAGRPRPVAPCRKLSALATVGKPAVRRGALSPPGWSSASLARFLPGRSCLRKNAAAARPGDLSTVSRLCLASHRDNQTAHYYPPGPNQRRPPHDLSSAGLCPVGERGREPAPLDDRGRQQCRPEPALGPLLPSL